MIDFLKEWVLSLAAVGIFLVLVEILAPSGKSKKFINLVSGFILILTMVQPFFQLFFNDIIFNELYIQGDNYVESIIGKSEEINENTIENSNGAQLKKKQNMQIIGIYRKRIIDKIQKLVLEVDEFQDVKSDIIINEDYNSQNYGEIKRIYVVAYLSKVIAKGEEGKSNLNINIEKVEEIRIDGKKTDNEANNNNSSSDSSLTNNHSIATNNIEKELIGKIEEKISLAFGLEKDNIIISINK